MLVTVIWNGSAIGNSSVLVRKKILDEIGGIDEDKDLVASEDFNTWLRIAKVTNKFKYLKETLGFYLVHEKSSQKRDLSIPHRKALAQFMHLYNHKQKLNIEVKLRYISANFNITNKHYNKAKSDFIFVIKNGRLDLKIKSLIKILLIIFKYNEKK